MGSVPGARAMAGRGDASAPRGCSQGFRPGGDPARGVRPAAGGSCSAAAQRRHRRTRRKPLRPPWRRSGYVYAPAFGSSSGPVIAWIGEQAVMVYAGDAGAHQALADSGMGRSGTTAAAGRAR